ncbi:hypothetical protein [Lentimonas sp. CC10]|nr:hypothetical protein [Lentimonas sp. CC10]
MNHCINKTELAWLVTRVAGVVFAWLALTKLSGFGFAVYLLSNGVYSELLNSPGTRVSWDLAWPHAVGFIFCLGLAVYFLKYGARFVALLCSEAPASMTRAEVDAAGSSKEALFAEWLAADSARRYLSREDQMREFTQSQARSRQL